jgi:hypothetical protein
MKRRIIFFIGAALLAVFVGTLTFAPLMLGGCAKQSSVAGAATTGRVLSPIDVRMELPGAYCGDAAYAQVDSSSLRAYYDDFRQALFDQGVTKWDERYDCNHFAGYYVDRAQAKFYLANFQSSTRAQTLALGVFWYQSARGGHAIVAAFTERGLIFIEPQTGSEVQLTPGERASAWLKVF